MYLVGLRGEHVGQRFDLGPETTLGREAGNTIFTPQDPQVSRRHARITITPNGAVIEDLGSSNGTILNGHRITAPTPIAMGDTIDFGQQSFRFEMTAAARVPEMGSSEVAPPPVLRPSEPLYGREPTGCSIPQLSSAGCLRMLILFLIAMAIVVIIGGLLALARLGIGALSGGHGRAPSSSGRSSAGGRAAPDNESDTGIVILSVRVVSRADGPAVLTKWKNATGQPVRNVTGTVTVFDISGNVVSSQPDQTIYSGQPVADGTEHEDPDAGGLVLHLSHSAGTPYRAEVTVTDFE